MDYVTEEGAAVDLEGGNVIVEVVGPVAIRERGRRSHGPGRSGNSSARQFVVAKRKPQQIHCGIF
jgi:uncharacterized protein (DUF2345 family)